jgi:hypothetical protein
MAATVASASVALADGERKPQTRSGFDSLSVCVERNATDDDTEIVVNVVPGDDGLAHLQMHAPDRRRVFTFSSPDPTILGFREFHLESPEPEGDRILAAYPRGKYYFWGQTHSREKFFGSALLSHELPAETVIIAPAQGSAVPPSALTIQWSPVPGITQYLLELENESADPEQSLAFNLGPDVTQFEVPAALLAPGAEYQVGVATVHPNCNVVFVETTFSTTQSP